MGTLAGAAPASAVADPGTGSISGTLTQTVGGLNVPAVGASVQLLMGSVSGSAVSDSSGHYSIGSLPAGTYYLSFTMQHDGNSYREFYDNASNFMSAKPVVVAAGATVTSIDALLGFASSITGTVTKDLGVNTAPAPGIRVWASTVGGMGYASAVSDAAGRYVLDGLFAGSYTIEFVSIDKGTVSKYYPNAARASAAVLVPVGDNTITADINVNLEEASFVTGTMTKNVGDVVTPAAGLPVSIYAADDGSYVGAEAANADGTFSLGSLMAGTYKVGFNQYGSGSSLSYLPEYFDNVADIASARTIIVGSGTTVGDINGEISNQPIVSTPAERLAGEDRFATSSAISANNFDPGVDVVYIASGANFPDALSAAPVAGKDKSPVLLVLPETIPPAVQTELLRLKPKSIVVLGSASSVSDAVAESLKTYTGGTVTRTFGADRFGTSAAISQTAFTPGVPVVYIANGYNFPDALSAA
ncbi:cell wall-binding repeat-containing protein, partial [Cryobacterium zhongshanensis]